MARTKRSAVDDGERRQAAKGRIAPGDAVPRRRPAASRRPGALHAAPAAEPALTLKEEIALLRDLIQQELEGGADVKDIVRAVDALGRALKVQYGLEGRAAQGLEEALARALAEIGHELGMTL